MNMTIRLQKNRALLLLALCTILFTVVPVAADESLPGSERRIVAMGDVHGAYDAMRAILEHAEIVDKRGRWIAGDTIFVQTGDLIDRGGKSLKALDWMIDLQKKAAKQGGEVILLLGNHEMMNLQGDLRYVTPAMREPFVDERSPFRITEVCLRHAKIVRELAKRLGAEPPKQSAAAEQCEQEQALGMIEYFETFLPKGRFGRVLREWPVVAEVDGVVFVHGGLGPALSGLDVDEINRTASEDLARWDRLRDWLIDAELIHAQAQQTETLRGVRRALDLLAADPEAFPEMPEDLDTLIAVRDWMIQRADGPLWFRGFAKWTQEEAEAALPGLLEGLNARHFAVGHSPHSRQKMRFGGRVFLMDTGMLAEAYRGVPSLLEIRDGRFTALYLDGSELLHDCRGHLSTETSETP